MSAIKSAQNRSSAVMQQRAEPHNSLDDFPTPPWATKATQMCLEWKPPEPKQPDLFGSNI